MLKKCKNCSELVEFGVLDCPVCGGGIFLFESQHDLVKDEFECLSVLANDVDEFDFSNYNLFMTNVEKSDCTLKDLILVDLINFLSYLGFSDGYVADMEVDLINYCLNMDFDKKELLDWINTSIPDDFLENIPNSFLALLEWDIVICNLDLDGDGDGGLFELFFNLFLDIGKLLVECDDDVTDDEINAFETYMKSLRDNLTSYKYAIESRMNDEDTNNLTASLSKNLEDYSSGDFENSNISINEFEEDKSLDELLLELDNLVGLDIVKNDVKSLINLIHVRKLRAERGMEQPPMSLHLVFSGNPGTGKTTVARLLSKIYHNLGLLSKGHLVETDRSGLVAGYVGQTAIKVQEVIKEAMGGILFIDEAYALSSGKEQDYGQEAIDTLLKAMEDHRDDFIVIVAGYPDLMEKFLHSNPGLQSRFNKFIHFDDYSPEELYDIFVTMCNKSDFSLDSSSKTFLKTYCQQLYDNRDDEFANGRDMRNIFEKVLTNQANRLMLKNNINNDELITFTREDFTNIS